MKKFTLLLSILLISFSCSKSSSSLTKLEKLSLFVGTLSKEVPLTGKITPTEECLLSIIDISDVSKDENSITGTVKMQPLTVGLLMASGSKAFNEPGSCEKFVSQVEGGAKSTKYAEYKVSYDTKTGKRLVFEDLSKTREPSSTK